MLIYVTLFTEIQVDTDRRDNDENEIALII